MRLERTICLTIGDKMRKPLKYFLDSLTLLSRAVRLGLYPCRALLPSACAHQQTLAFLRENLGRPPIAKHQ